MDKILTENGYKKLKDELEYLKNVALPQVAERIAEAKELGDLSENAEYQDAKDEQGLIAKRIMEIEEILRNATILSTEGVDTEIVEVGNKVVVESDGKKFEYEIVGMNEANPSQGKISNESPLGMALLGKKRGDEVELDLPKGKVKYKIVDIK